MTERDRTRRALTEDDRELIRSLYVQNKTQAFIAAVIGRSQGTVSTTLFDMRAAGLSR
jgi:DNA-directed RNA polymerase specialized sigma24 family protein